MLRGYPWRFGQLIDSDVSNLNDLSKPDAATRDNDNFDDDDKVPIYIQQLFRNFTNQVTIIQINTYWMDTYVYGAKDYGYLKLHDTLSNASSVISLPKFIKIFRQSTKERESTLDLEGPRPVFKFSRKKLQDLQNCLSQTK